MRTSAAAAAAGTEAADSTAVDNNAIESYNRVPGIRAIKSRDLMRTVRVFAACTSAHGFSRLNHPVRSCQVGWTVVIMAAFVGLTINLSSLVIKYRDEPISTKINPRGSQYVPPDITVCNRMMFAVSKIFSSTRVSNSTSRETAYRYDIDARFRPVFDSVQNIREVLELSVRRYLMLNYGSYEGDTDLLRMEEEGVYNLPNLVIRDTYGIKFLSQFSADPANMLLSCTYGTRACDIHDFQPLALPAFPSCVTFSAQRFSQRRPNVTVNGLNELRIGLFTDSQHDSPVVTSGLLKLPGDWFNMQSPGGVVVFVHQPGIYPTHGNRIEAPTNQETVVAIRYLEYTSKSTRSYRCLANQQQLQYMVLEDQSLKPATFQAQLADCYVSVAQEILLNQCGFIDPTLPLSLSVSYEPRRGNLSNLLRGSAVPGGVNLISPTDLIDYVYQVFKRLNASELPTIIDALLDNEVCLRRAQATANRDPSMQRCVNYCQAKVYATSVIPVAWPEGPEAGGSLRLMVQRWLQSNANYANRSASAGTFEEFVQQANWNLHQSFSRLGRSDHDRNKNYLAIRFRAADSQGLDMQTVESSAYELFDLFSDIGGILGLFVGISVLTVCEVAELCLQLAVMSGMIAYRRRADAGKQRSRLDRMRRVSVMTWASMQSGGGLSDAADEMGMAWQLQLRTSRV